MSGEKEKKDSRCLEFRELTEEIALAVGPPKFYSEKKEEVERSRHLFKTHPVSQALLVSLTDHEDYPGHGLSHVRKVALDAGALVLIEGKDVAAGDGELDRMVFLAHLAGLLHDIKRAEPDHAHRGAEAAGKILRTLDLKESEARFIVQAIANHEAFQPAAALDDPAAQLLSDALYDGDKFRWGPDNFTETLWAIVETRRIKIESMMKAFPRGLEATERIRDTFRTPTGRRYGPDFIDRALAIGRALYSRFSSSP